MKTIAKIALTLGVVVALGLILAPMSYADNSISTAENANRVDDNSRILVWTAQGATPGNVAADNPGQLAYINGSGVVTPLADVLAGSSRVQVCGPNAVSPDGRLIGIYQGIVGGVTSSLYISTEGGAPALANDMFQPIGCVGANGIFSYSPDSSYMTLIEYERDFNVGFADGTMRILDTTTFEELFSERTIVGFEQTPEGVLFVRFFRDDRSEADEVAVTFWDGNIDREIISFFAEDDCRYLNANIATAPDGLQWLGLVQRCSGQTSQNVYRVNPQDRTVELIFSVDSPGGFPQSTEANRFYFSTNGNSLFYTIPDGFTLETVSLNRYDIDTGTQTTLIDRQVVIAGVDGSDTGNEPTLVSPNGQWLTVVTTDPDGSRSRLNFYNLTDPTAEPIVIEAGGRDDVFSFLQYTRDGNRLVYVSGGRFGNDNSLFFIDMTSDNLNPLRVRRGNFSSFAALSPDGNEIAIADFFVLEESDRGPDYLVLKVINLDTSEEVVLYEGGEVIDGQSQNLEFMVPVYWLQ